MGQRSLGCFYEIAPYVTKQILVSKSVTYWSLIPALHANPPQNKAPTAEVLEMLGYVDLYVEGREHQGPGPGVSEGVP